MTGLRQVELIPMADVIDEAFAAQRAGTVRGALRPLRVGSVSSDILSPL
jgi:hypothetical protein